jgi:hypothetical protein
MALRPHWWFGKQIMGKFKGFCEKEPAVLTEGLGVPRIIISI